mgnify:CR=1 FL=1
MSECSNTGTNTMILACAGGSNVGQMTNRLAVELTRDGHGKLSCLAGMGARGEEGRAQNLRRGIRAGLHGGSNEPAAGRGARAETHDGAAPIR